MKLTNLEIKEINKKYYSSNNKDNNLSKDTVNNISIETFDIINTFLTDIKLSTKTNTLSTSNMLQNFKKRFDSYQKLYTKYYNKVITEDKLIFAKLMNYLTAEGNCLDESNWRNGCSSNMPLVLQYKINYNGKNIEGYHCKNEKIYIESHVYHKFRNEILEPLMGNDLSNDNNHKQTELEICTFYDIYFNTLNLADLPPGKPGGFRLNSITKKVL